MLFSSLADAKGQEAKAIDEAVQEMLKAGPHERLLAVSAPPSGVEVWQFDDPDKAVAAQAKLIEATGAALLKAGVLKDKPEIQPHAHKYKGFDFTAVRVNWDVAKLVPPDDAPMNNRVNAGALKQLLGDGLNLWFGTDGKTFVQVTAADWDSAEKQLDGYFKGENPVGGDAAFAVARRQLPAKATVWMLIDVVRQVGGAERPGPGGAARADPGGAEGQARLLRRGRDAGAGPRLAGPVRPGGGGAADLSGRPLGRPAGPLIRGHARSG